MRFCYACILKAPHVAWLASWSIDLCYEWTFFELQYSNWKYINFFWYTVTLKEIDYLIKVNGIDERQSSFWRWSSRLSLSDWAVLVRLLYALHLPPQTSRFTILKILFRENRKHVVLYIWYYILYCIIYIVIGYRYFKFLKKNTKTKNHKIVISVHDFIWPFSTFCPRFVQPGRFVVQLMNNV